MSAKARRHGSLGSASAGFSDFKLAAVVLPSVDDSASIKTVDEQKSNLMHNTHALPPKTQICDDYVT